MRESKGKGREGGREGIETGERNANKLNKQSLKDTQMLLVNQATGMTIKA